MAHGTSWTAEEDALLAEFYPAEGAGGVAERLPERTRSAIEQRAARLGVRRQFSGDRQPADALHRLWARFVGVPCS